jgi:hypothetical protein
MPSPNSAESWTADRPPTPLGTATAAGATSIPGTSKKNQNQYQCRDMDASRHVPLSYFKLYEGVGRGKKGDEQSQGD